MRINWSHYDWIVVNTSAGKDSQAMLDFVVKEAEARGLKDRVVAVHCDLGEEEWEGTKELAAEQAAHYGVRFEVVRRPQGGILQHTLKRHATLKAQGKDTPAWPSSVNRWCTSDHKRGQVGRLLTKLASETRQSQAGKRVRILNCMGMRAGESCSRSELLPFRLDRRNTNGRRVVHTYLPIHGWSVDQVWDRIRLSGVKHHYAYDLGMPRLSCCFCIFAPRNALLLAGKHNPKLLDSYCDVEKKVGHTFRQGLPIVEIRDALARGEEPGQIKTWEM